MAFNEFGDILAAREGGPLIQLHSPNKDGQQCKATVYCDEVKNIQGILPLNGQAFVVGSGPQGTGLYRISDAADADKEKSDKDKSDKDKSEKDKSLSKSEAKHKKTDLLIKFTGEMAEHGPHAPVLGPDGLIYDAARRSHASR